MRTFTEFLEEAYAFLPKSEKDILASPLSNAKEVASAFKLIMAAQRGQKIKVEDPLAIDITASNNIKVHRDLDGIVDIKDISAKTGVKLTFGNGSRGNAGAGNRGNAFEKRLSKDLGLFVQTRDLNADYEYPIFMKDFAKKHLMDAKDIRIIDEGGLNKKRPLKYEGGKLSIESPSIKDIGATVTDITVEEDSNPLYLSLKLGSTVTFFNIGISKFLNKSDLESGKVTNDIGKAILDLFAIDHDRYVDTFAKYEGKPTKGTKRTSAATAELIDVTRQINRNKLIHFLSTGIGYGYFLVHAHDSKPGSKIKWFYMDESSIKKHVTPISVKVKYPQVGSAKRIDVVIQTETFEFKINIRNKQGGIAPSHIMCDYKIKQ